MNEAADTIAVAGADGVLRIVRRTGEAWTDAAVTTGWWPTWRPGRAEYAVSRVDTRPGAAHSSLHLQGVDGGDIPIPGSLSAPPALIAERVAHYALWGPGGRTLCYVMPAGRTLAARAWVVGSADGETLVGGSPIFPAWHPGGDRLALHHGATVTLVELGSGDREQLSTTGAGFRTPAFSDDGEWLAFAEGTERGTTVVVRRNSDGERREVARFDGGVAFGFRPGTHELTVAVTTGDEAGVFRDLYTVSVERGSEPERLVHGPLLAFWWAPTGDRLAVLMPAYTGDGRYQFRFYGPDARFLRAMEPTTLSPDMRTMVSFFDQYALSHRTWSADGRRFAFAGRLLTDGIPASFADGQLDCVMIADAVSGGPWTRVSAGFAGFFPPGEVNGG